MYSKLGRCQIAISEGVQDATGESIGARLIQGEADAHGNAQLSGSGALGDQLANMLKEKLTPKGGKAPRVRADTLGYPQRCYPDASPVDQAEARLSGRRAAEIARSGDFDGSIAIQRENDSPYKPKFVRVPLEAVAAKTRYLPDAHKQGTNDISQAYVEWLKPLVGPLPEVGRL